MRDNQGRDLEAMKRHHERMEAVSKTARAENTRRFEETIKKYPLPDWTTVDGVEVLRSGTSRFVAAPRNGKRTAANFEVIDLNARELVCVLKRKEVSEWLWRSAIAEGEDGR